MKKTLLIKRILLLLIIFPVLLTAQYSKKELKKKEKWLKKLELRIVNRGVDLNETFVFFVDRELSETAAEKIANLVIGGYNENWDFVISEFENAMFVAGLDVGTYEFKEIEKGSKNNAAIAGNLIVNGRYLFEFDRAIERYVKVAIKDVSNNMKTVATISFRNNIGLGNYMIRETIIIEHVISEFIKSNS
ncbi:MAG: hypothetical protein DBW74_01160 [Cryomorphaceae bacterium]|jgi:hypothetical protein|nr:MAG: hypothetical protein DBW74_01160 [Cryomorphaceae bacterium]|tara:strand:- start:641 stop:1210 length:570 start_codon:yes stop_codon:yes gene_type:complete